LPQLSGDVQFFGFRLETKRAVRSCDVILSHEQWILPEMKLRVSHFALASALAFAGASTTALAEDTGEGSQHPHNDENILVTAGSLDELDFIAGQDVLTQDEIQRDLDGQIGEVLAKTPGVSATSFAPGASRPILRGQDGERVRVLIDGLGSADVGNTSSDHATTIDALTVERIEVLRGPTALLFGSQAIGGVVNVIDRRIPLAVPENGLFVEGLAAADTASDLRSGAVSLDAGLGENFAVHVGGSWRETDDLEIAGFQLTDDLRADLLGDAAEEEEEGEFEEAEELREAAEQRGVLPNSATETWTATGGFGVFFGESSFGASVSYFDTDYGLVSNPEGGHHHGEEEGGEEEEEEGEETVSIGLEQLRLDFKGDIALGDGMFSRLKLRGGYSDYTHTEFEGDEVGTVFDTETIEARAELIFREGMVIGAQFTSRDFAAVGEEAFVAPNETTQFALFTAGEYDLGAVQLEGAARYERVDVSSDTLGLDRNFDLVSGAVSAVLGGDGDARFGLTLSRSERAPAGEELFANGPHIATQAFEIGNPNLDTESALGAEVFLRAALGNARINASVFYQSYDDYIYLSPTGEEEDELPVFQILQRDADFFGFEAGLEVPLVEQDGFDLTADLRASYVDGSLNDDANIDTTNGNVPRVPPLSLLGALDADIGSFGIRAELEHYGSQNEVVEFETATDSFTFANLYLSWRPLADNRNVVLQLAGENLFDVTGRRHTSFTKDYVPLAGRNIRASVRFGF
jgi:iron complex outermembrane receptor protein